MQVGVALATVTVLGGVLASCGSDEASDEASGAATTVVSAVGVSIDGAWSRQPAAGQAVTAVYGLVSNPLDHDITVVAASSPTTDRVELHETIENADGTMSMRQRTDGFVIAAGATFEFVSGGPHIMLFDIDPDAYPDPVEVTLSFDDGNELTFDAEVRELPAGDMSSMDHGSMDHGSTDHGSTGG